MRAVKRKKLLWVLVILVGIGMVCCLSAVAAEEARNIAAQCSYRYQRDS